MFGTSRDGKSWTPPAYRDWIKNGASSKPNFEGFFGVYYLGGKKSTRVNGISRSVFNINDKAFRYVSLHEYRGSIYFTVTQGDSSPSCKERILFGKLE